MTLTWEEQVDRLRQDFPDSVVRSLPDGGWWVEIGNVPTAPGWSSSTTRIAVLVPPNFPTGKPDGFWLDPELKAATGREPGNRSAAESREGKPWAKICWQVSNWDPARETLRRYVKAMLRRFVEVPE